MQSRPFICWAALLAFCVASSAHDDVTPVSTNSPVPMKISKEALRIHRSSLVVDGHNDLPWRVRGAANMSWEEADISKPIPSFHTDIPRLRAGGLGAQFWAAYVPPVSAKTGVAAHQTLEQIDLIHRMIARYPETFELALTASDIVRVHKSGKIASLIGIENGHAIENSIALLRMYYDLGVRYMTLTHGDSLDWADSATDTPKANGLSAFGKDVVREMNRLGMLVDISHVSPKTMHDVLDITVAPIIASHSSAYAVAQHARNVPDDVLKRIKANDGVVMVNFYSGFVVPESAKTMAGMFDVMRRFREQYPAEADYQKARKEWVAKNPITRGNVKHVVDHIDHIVKVAGIDHVGLGSDFDGITLLPEGLEDVSTYPAITQELLDRGYSAGAIRKVLGQNLLRAMRGAEKAAAKRPKTKVSR